jgi:hypothetical protein
MSLWNYVQLPVCVRSSGGSAETRSWGFYHGFGYVFRQFGLFLALAPAWGESKGWQHKVRENCG